LLEVRPEDKAKAIVINDIKYITCRLLNLHVKFKKEDEDLKSMPTVLLDFAMELLTVILNQTLEQAKEAVYQAMV
jgi:hypothetical protein